MASGSMLGRNSTHGRFVFGTHVSCLIFLEPFWLGMFVFFRHG